jgi:predicted ATP-grasp superfamily ATP-dependent carboligase
LPLRRIAVAALSARALSEAATREGFEVFALDVFGDRDTQRAASGWRAIGNASALRIEPQRLLDALQALAERDGAQGWIAGSGFEGQSDLLRLGAERLPLIGNDALTVQRLRDPRVFFAALDAQRIAHPAVQHAWPHDASGWLLKDAGGCGGTHIRRATAATNRELTPSRYLQQQRPGTPMSAAFIADGRLARILGCNVQLTGAAGASPWAYAGVIGPVPIAEAVDAQVEHAVQSLVATFGLRGLGSLDFLLHEQTIEVLEVNPRPSASHELYAQAEHSLIGAHVRACEAGELPVIERAPSAPVRGNTIVFARSAMQLDPPAADWLAAQPDTHDLPQPHTHFARGDPVCSVGASGHAVPEVRAALAARCATLLATLETVAVKPSRTTP